MQELTVCVLNTLGDRLTRCLRLTGRLKNKWNSTKINQLRIEVPLSSGKLISYDISYKKVERVPVCVRMNLITTSMNFALTCPLNLLLNLMEVMEAEWSSKVWTKLKLFCTSKMWISRSRPAEASNLWPTSEEKRLRGVRKFSLKWKSELSFTYPISNSPLTPQRKKNTRNPQAEWCCVFLALEASL